MVDFSDIESKFSLRTSDEPEDDLCYVVPGQRETIKACNFDPDAKTFVVIHGWTVSTEHKDYKFLFFGKIVEFMSIKPLKVS